MGPEKLLTKTHGEGIRALNRETVEKRDRFWVIRSNEFSCPSDDWSVDAWELRKQMPRIC
jgi:hypothetical protein